jgi:hypothetical protein
MHAAGKWLRPMGLRVHTATRSRAISLSLSATAALPVSTCSSVSREAFPFLEALRSEVHIGGRTDPRLHEGAPTHPCIVTSAVITCCSNFVYTVAIVVCSHRSFEETGKAMLIMDLSIYINLELRLLLPSRIILACIAGHGAHETTLTVALLNVEPLGSEFGGRNTWKPQSYKW